MKIKKFNIAREQDLKKAINYEEYTFNFDDFRKAVILEKNRYRSEYFNSPKYLKIPSWFYKILKNALNPYFSIDEENREKFLDLIICKTESITELEEFEVF